MDYDMYRRKFHNNLVYYLIINPAYLIYALGNKKVAQIDKQIQNVIGHNRKQLIRRFNNPFGKTGQQGKKKQKEVIPPYNFAGKHLKAVNQLVMPVPKVTDDKKTGKKDKNGF
jgi:hypothetical protein